jgi:hypothetical protein
MAFTSTVLSVSPQSIFTSVGNNAITTTYICNTGNIEVQFSIYAIPAGTAVTANRLIYYKVPLTPYDTYVIDSEKLILEAGDSLYAEIFDPYAQRVISLSETAWSTGDGTIYASFWSSDRSEYMIGGANGKLAVSSTGESWKYIAGLANIGWPTGSHVRGITRIPGKKYLVGGDNGYVALSSDGEVWDYITSLRSTAWGQTNVNAVASNGSLYMVVGDQSKVATSIDGIVWTLHVGLTGLGSWGIATVSTVIWTGEAFMLGGEGGRITFTVDGTEFNPINSLRNNPAWGASTRVSALSYSGFADVGYVALSIDNNKAARSANGVTWTYDSGLASIASNTTPGISSVTYRPGYGFYAFGQSSDIFVFDNTLNWTKINELLNPPWSGIAGTSILWNPARAEFIATGYDSKVSTSPDALTWTYRTVYSSAGITMPNVVVTVSSISI